MSEKLKKIFFAAITISLLLFSNASRLASAAPTPTAAHAVKPFHRSVLLDPSFDPLTVGGVPFCVSGSLGTILCYPPSFFSKAYNFPSAKSGEGGSGGGAEGGNGGTGGLDGSGQTIVIVDSFGSPTLQSDLNTFDRTFGLPATTVTVLCGPTWTGASTDTCPAFDLTLPIDQLCAAQSWWEETTLDVALSHGLAPGAKIVLVVVPDCFDTSFNSAEMAVVSQSRFKGSIMSQSFGEPEDLVGCLDFPCTQIDPTIKATQDAVFSLATANHWTLIASSGDDGANSALSAVGTPELTPSWPATSPLNLGVGGTQGLPYGGQFGPPPGPGGTFTCAAHATCNTGLVIIAGGSRGCTTAARPGVPSGCRPTGYGGEAAWNEFDVFGLRTSTGGGVSTMYEKPSYQRDLSHRFPTILGSSVKASGRLTPDVSFNAAIAGGVLAYAGFLGRWVVFGGTSASSPAWAAIIAILNQKNGAPVGFVNPAIYRLAASGKYTDAFHDITHGENSDSAGQAYVCGLDAQNNPIFCPPADGFAAGPRYDLTTGWGTPDVAHFIQDIGTFLHGENGGGD